MKGVGQRHTPIIKERQPCWKRILIVGDDPDVTTTFKVGIEDRNNINNVNKRIVVVTSNDPLAVLSEFKPYFYDLLLINIDLPHMNGFELYEKILSIDINIKVCFMSCGEINREALREVHPSISLGCFI